jgi:ferredoxin
VRICRIRLSDRVHVRLTAGAADLSRVKRCTPSFPKTSFQENTRAPRPPRLARRLRKRRSDYDRIRSTWRSRWGEQNFDDRWRQALIDGVIAGTRLEPAVKPAAKFTGWTPTAPQGGMSAIIRVDPSVFDGRFANNAWLQECPQPFSKAVWGNAVEMALADAKRLGIKEGDEVEVSVGKRALSGPMRLSNGLAPGVVQLSLGYGRTHAGSMGSGVGFNVAVLRTASSPWIARNVSLRRISPNGRLSPSTAGLFALAGKAEELAPEAEAGAKASTLRPMASFFPPWPTPIGDPYAWAMVIDTGACIGCNACVVACQSENNVPSIGPDEVDWGRDMHWLRIDVYDHGAPPEPRPVLPARHLCKGAPWVIKAADLDAEAVRAEAGGRRYRPLTADSNQQSLVFQ